MKRQLSVFCGVLVVCVALTGLVDAQEKPGEAEASVRKLVGFETEAEMGRWGVAKINAALSAEHPTEGKSAMKITVPADGKATFARWAKQDWSGWQQLVMDVFNAQDEAVTITVSVWDVPGEGAYAKRYQGKYTVNEGPNAVTLELAELRVNDRSRIIDAGQIQQLVIGIAGLNKETVLHFDNFRLTGRFKGSPAKGIFAWNRYPGLFFYYRERPAHRVEMTVTYDRVTDPAALRLDFPAGEGYGRIFRELGRNEGKDFGNYEGISFWVKGDGSTAQGAVLLSFGSAPAAFFPLSNKEWHRVDVKWSDFNGRINPGNIGTLAFGLKDGSAKPAHYIIDRPQFIPKFADLDAEADLAKRANAAKRKPDPAAPDPATLIARGNALVKARELLKNKKPIKILCWGDSVTGGAQLWTVGDDAAQAKARYRGQLQQHLIKHFGYEDINVMGVTHGGYQVRQAIKNVKKEILDNKPDVVVVAFGAGDAIYSNLATFKELYPKMVGEIRAAGIEVILFVPTPIMFKVPASDGMAGFVREYGKQQNLATADVNAGFMGQGELFLGRWICDNAHPNQRAHEYMGKILFELFK